jgi:hypothetical protein
LKETVLVVFETRSSCLAQAGHKLTILLLQPLEYWITGMHHHTQPLKETSIGGSSEAWSERGDKFRFSLNFLSLGKSLVVLMKNKQ